MTQFGTISLGRLPLVEFPTQVASIAAAAPSTNAPTGRTLALAGQESTPAASTVGTTAVALRAKEADLHGSVGALIPVTFTDKSQLNGYYSISDASADLQNWEGEMVSLTWKLDLARIGTDLEVDLESRLTGGVRNSSFAASASAVRWHAPSIGHYAYFTATGNTPSAVVRTGADGPTTVYTGLPLTGSVIPRWGCAVANYLGGRARFLDDNGIERAGILFANGNTSSWTLSNALVNITPLASGGVLNIASYSNGAYQSKNWDLQFNAVSLGVPLGISLLRNEPELVVARLVWSVAGPTRITADLTLRRGSRFVELYLQSQVAGTFKAVRSSAEAGTNGASGAYVTATSEDSAGTRYFIGSALANTQDLANGGVSLAATTTMDVVVGAVTSQSVLNANPYFEANTANWTPNNCTFAQSGTRAHQGSFSALMTPNGVAALVYAESEQEPVTALASYQVSGWCWPTASIAANIGVSINWYDATHTYITTTSNTSSAASGAWTFLTGNNTAPSNAAYATVVPTISGTPPASNLVWWDELKLRATVPSGDAASDLYAQYLAAPSELVQGIRR